MVQKPDNSIQYVTLDGSTAVLVADAPSSLRAAGYGGVPLGGAPMTDGPIVYVRQLWGGFYALDTKLGQLFPLAFVASPSQPVAVRPLTEGLWSGEEPQISLAWGEFSASNTATARLYLSSPDGSQVLQALEETYGASDPWTQFLPWRWREDGQLYLTRQPVEGMGGFPPFVSAANLWLFDPRSGGSVELVSREVTGGQLCLDAIAPDDRRVAHHCDDGKITILYLESGESLTVSLPDELPRDVQLGSARFSPDGTRIALAAMSGGPGRIEEARGYVVLSGNLDRDRASFVIATTQPGDWFSVVGWLSTDVLVLQSYATDPSGARWPAVWTVRADGAELLKVADGTLLSYAGE